MLTKSDFSWDAAGAVRKLIEQWDPSGCASEKECEISLLEFLQVNSKDVEIAAQWGIGRQRVDIVVGRKVAIELKWNLTSVTEVERTKGQVHTYSTEFEHTFLVVCGGVDTHLIHCLREYARELSNRGWTFFDSIGVEVLIK